MNCTTTLVQAPILIADDSPVASLLEVQVLKRAGFDGPIEIVRDGEAAWDYLNRSGIYAAARRPMFALLDIMMPKLNGLDILRRVRMHCELSMLPVVIVSASLNCSDMMESYKLGAAAYVLKNGNLAEIVEILKERFHSCIPKPQCEEPPFIEGIL